MGMCSLNLIHSQNPRARVKRGVPDRKELEKPIESRPELGPTSRSDGASDWRRGPGTSTGPSRIDSSHNNTNPKWKEAGGRSFNHHNQNQNDEDAVPEWMMDDPAVAAVKPKSGGGVGLASLGDGSLEGSGVGIAGGRKKLKGLEELQAQNDEIAAYRNAMKDKERRMRGEPAQEAEVKGEAEQLGCERRNNS